MRTAKLELAQKFCNPKILFSFKFPTIYFIVSTTFAFIFSRFDVSRYVSTNFWFKIQWWTSHFTHFAILEISLLLIQTTLHGGFKKYNALDTESLSGLSLGGLSCLLIPPNIINSPLPSTKEYNIATSGELIDSFAQNCNHSTSWSEIALLQDTKFKMNRAVMG